MIDRYVDKNGLDKLKNELEHCVRGIFQSWQDIWYKYQEISIFADNLGK